MSKAKLEAARELIRSKQYAEARAVLRTMADDATARKWLARLDEIAPEKKPTRKRSRLAGVLALVVLCGVIALLTPRQPAATSTSRVDASTLLPAASMPSRTPAPSLTITQTLTPSPTFTAAPPEPTTGSMLAFDEAEYERLLIEGLAHQTSVRSVRVADGRAAGGERGFIVTYVSTATDIQIVYVEWLSIYSSIGAAIVNRALDVDAVVLIVGDVFGNAAGIVVASAADLRAYYDGDISNEVFFSRLNITSMTDLQSGSSAPTCPTSNATCASLATCQEARACFAAGNLALDGDVDGIPCENLCAGG